jgi:hypothetical protein
MLATSPTPPSGTEQWGLITIPGDITHLAYAFKVTVLEPFPASVNTLGYWGVWANMDSKLIIMPTRPILIVGRGESQAIQPISELDALFPAGNISDFGVVYFIHAWIDSIDAELWVLE